MMLGVGAGLGSAHDETVGVRAAEGDKHEFTTGYTSTTLLNNGKTPATVTIPEQEYCVKQVIINWKHNKTNGITATVKVGGAELGTGTVGGYEGTKDTTIGDGTTALSGEVSITWSSTLTGSGKGTLYINSFTLVEGSSKKLSSITASLTDTTKTYFVGNTLNASDFTVTPTYDDGTSGDPITDGTGVTLTNATLNNEGDNTVTVTYGGLSVGVIVSAIIRTITSIEVTGSLTKTTYYTGENWDLSGLKLQVNYSAGDALTLDINDSSLTITKTPDVPTLNEGLTISITYQDKSCSYTPSVSVLSGPIYSKSMSDWNWDESYKGKITANSVLQADDNKAWRLSSSEYFVSSSTPTYMLGDYSNSKNGVWSTFKGNTYYKNIASTISSTNTYAFVMYSQNFTINKLNRVDVSWTSVLSISDSSTTKAYILTSIDGGLKWNIKATISTLRSNKSISWQGDDYSSVDNVIVAFMFDSSVNNSQLRGISIDLYGDSFGEATWKVQNIEITSDSTNVEIGATLALSAAINEGYEDAVNKEVVWKSDNETIATIDETTGVVTGVAVGSVYITATAKDGSNEYGLIEINVVAATVHVTSVSLNVSSLKLVEYESSLLTATVLPENATDKTVTWTSDNDNVVDVSNGELIAYSAGSATITVTTNDGDYTATCIVTVAPFVGEYEKVTSTDQLFEGAKVMIAPDLSYSVTSGNWNTSGYYDKATANLSSDRSTLTSSGGTIFTIRKYGYKYVFEYSATINNKTNTYYLNSNSTTQSLETIVSDNTAWSIDLDADNIMTGSGTGNDQIVFNYNNNYSRFKNYKVSSNMQNISLYIETASKTASDIQVVDTFENTEMHMRDYNSSSETTGLCKGDSGYYQIAKTKYNSLSTTQKNEFANRSDAVERLSKWAIANGESFDSINGTFNVKSSKNIISNISGNESLVTAVVVISLVSLTSISSFLLYRKKKENI